MANSFEGKLEPTIVSQKITAKKKIMIGKPKNLDVKILSIFLFCMLYDVFGYEITF